MYVDHSRGWVKRQRVGLTGGLFPVRDGREEERGADRARSVIVAH